METAVRELPRDADPYMTREARAERAVWRLAHFKEWSRDIENLAYYNPEYAYDVGHEYEDDWTTDPDHNGNGIEFAEYDADGVLKPIDDRRWLLEGPMLTMLRKMLGNRVESQAHVCFPVSVAEQLALLTQEGYLGTGDRPTTYVKPNLMVFPPNFALSAGERRPRADCALRLHQDDPPPELVVEILTWTTVQQDLVDKQRLYAALGVREYWVCDVGGIRAADSPVELQVFRLTDAGDYALCTGGVGMGDGGCPAPAGCTAPVGRAGLLECGVRHARPADHRGLRTAVPVVGCLAGPLARHRDRRAG